MISEIATAVRDLVRQGGANLDLKLLSTIYDVPASVATVRSVQAPPPEVNRDAISRLLLPKLMDLDAERLAEMNINSVDMHLLSLGLPGVQMFEPDQAVEKWWICQRICPPRWTLADGNPSLNRGV